MHLHGGATTACRGHVLATIGRQARAGTNLVAVQVAARAGEAVGDGAEGRATGAADVQPVGPHIQTVLRVDDASVRRPPHKLGPNRQPECGVNGHEGPGV